MTTGTTLTFLTGCRAATAMRLGVWLLVLAAVIVFFPGLAALPDKAAAQAKFTEEGGDLRRGRRVN